MAQNRVLSPILITGLIVAVVSTGFALWENSKSSSSSDIAISTPIPSPTGIFAPTSSPVVTTDPTSSPAPTSSNSVSDVTKLAVGDKVGLLTVASITPAPGDPEPLSNTNYDIKFSGSVTCRTTLLVSDTGSRPIYSLDPTASDLCTQLPVINGIHAYDQTASSMIGPAHQGFSMESVFGKYNSAYSHSSKLTATYTFEGIEYFYRQATGTNGYLNPDMSISGATDPSISK